MVKVLSLLGLLAALIMISACGRGANQESYAAYPTPEPEVIELETIPPQAPDIEQPPAIEGTPEPEVPHRPNFVDVRVELLTAIFRRAGRSEFMGLQTSYQRDLFEFLVPHREHPAVIFASDLPLGFDAVPGFAIHMERTDNGFALIDNRCSLFSCGRWTEESVATFIDLVNDFYIDTGFGEFFDSQTEHFENVTEIFIREVFSYLNVDWFYAHGVRPDQMRIVINPNHTQTGYGPTLWDDPYGTVNVSYSIVPGRYNYTRGGDWLRLTVHEFNHTFANPIAARWYEENESFRELSRASVGSIPWYAESLTMAFEYVTRAYEILYMVENEGDDPIPHLLDEMMNGFPYIETVFAMITDHEPMGIDQLLSFRLRGAYTLEDETFSYTHAAGQTINWRNVYFPDGFNAIPPPTHTQFGNIFPTDTGDVLYVVNPNNIRQIVIDLGGFRGLRSYYVFPQGVSGSNHFISGAEIDDMIAFALETDFIINPQVHEFDLDGSMRRWHMIDLLGATLDLNDFFHVTYGNIFDSQTGDVMLLTRDDRTELLVDLGPGDWLPDIRSYFVLPIN